MKQIKSAKAKNWIVEHTLDKRFNDGLDHHCVRAETAVLAVHYAETEAYEQLEALKQKAVDRANITMGAMILDGYEPEDSCVKYVQELIEELKELNKK